MIFKCSLAVAYSMYVHAYVDQPLAGLKRLASFGAGGGIGARFFPTGANLVQGWVCAVFCASAGRCTEKEKVLENHLFHVKNPLLGENLVLRNHVLGLGNFDETS